MEELQGVTQVDLSRLSFVQLRLRHSQLEDTLHYIDGQLQVEGDQDRSLAVFLASDAAASITGSAYSIDGGWVAQ